jgi:hypothetical protein
MRYSIATRYTTTLCICLRTRLPLGGYCFPQSLVFFVQSAQFGGGKVSVVSTPMCCVQF